MRFAKLLKRLLTFCKSSKVDGPKVKLWMRMGVTFEVSAEQARKILDGDSETFDAVLDSRKSWHFDGDSYIPDIIVSELCVQLGLNYEDYKGDVNFDVWRGDSHGA